MWVDRRDAVAVLLINRSDVCINVGRETGQDRTGGVTEWGAE